MFLNQNSEASIPNDSDDEFSYEEVQTCAIFSLFKFDFFK